MAFVKLGMPFVELTTDVDNLPSQKVIKNNGGVLHEKFVKPAVHGGTEDLRFRIYLWFAFRMFTQILHLQ